MGEILGFDSLPLRPGSGRISSTLDEGKIEQADASRLNFLIPDPARPIFAPFVAIPGRRGRLEHLIIVAE
jgi:hypothetical protein